MDPDAVARVRTTALRNNLDRARQAAPGCPVMAVIKADAYGHGLVAVASVLDAADAFGVARFPAAVELRRAGIDKDIVVLSGRLDRDAAALAIEQNLQIVVFDESQLEILEEVRGERPIKVWLKIDSGMGRLGIMPAAFPGVLARLRDCPLVADDICLMTHLSCADDADSPVTHNQLRVFAETIGAWEGDISIANSAGLLGWPDCLRPGPLLRYSGRNWIRPGLMLYGVSPQIGRTDGECGLVPAMVLEGRLLSVREVPAGAAVGYGADWRAQRDSRIGIVNVGYADGYPWRLSNRAQVSLAGCLVPVIGRVSMDMISIDLSAVPTARIGDPVMLWGDDPQVADLAAIAGTSPYELLTRVGTRVIRQYA